MFTDGMTAVYAALMYSIGKLSELSQSEVFNPCSLIVD